MKKYLIAGLLVAGFVTPAFAAAEFYVAQNSPVFKPSARSCSRLKAPLTATSSRALRRCYFISLGTFG